MKVNGRKRRLESSPDDEEGKVKKSQGVKEINETPVEISTDESDEDAVKESQSLKDRVKELDKTKESVKVDKNKKQLEKAVKENKRLMDRVKELETSLATKTKSVKVGEDNELLEMRTKVEDERVKVEKEQALPCCSQGHFLCSPCMDSRNTGTSLPGKPGFSVFFFLKCNSIFWEVQSITDHWSIVDHFA